MIQICRYTNRGGREYNEDYSAVFRVNHIVCAIIADGLGGHGGGSIASETAVNSIVNSFHQNTEEEISRQQYDDWFEKANAEVLAHQTPECRMRTTLGVLSIMEETCKANWAHVGDSRIYHFTDGKMEFCTFDHSVSRMAVLAGEIGMEEIRFHSDRNKLLKTIGQEPAARPEYGECILDKGIGHVFLLCTDGFWEYVMETEMEDALCEAATPREWLSEMCHILRGKSDGKNDNNTAVAVWIKEVGESV